MISFLALLALTLLWLLLPMLPALHEIARPTDVAPLKVVDRSSGYVAYFARNFRQYLDRQMAALPAEAQAGDYVGKLPDGTQFIRVHKSPTGLAHEVDAGTQHRLVVVDMAMTLQNDETFLMEVYARAPTIGGAGSMYRAIYADRELGLGERSTVMRWAHACGTLGVGSHSVLRGRITSDTAVVLGGNVVFERIGAPVISVGTVRVPPPASRELTSWQLPPEARQVGDHYRIDGDLEIPGGVRVTTSLVVAGALTIGPGARVEGSVKAHHDVELGDGAQVRGALVARRQIMIGAQACLDGPVIAEDRIRIGQGSVVGGPDLPATVSAPEVELMAGATVYGQISAPMGGRTF